MANDLQDFDAAAGNLQPIVQRIHQLERGGGSREQRKALERLVEHMARFDKGKRVRIKLGRARYNVYDYRVDGQYVDFYLIGRDGPVSVDTNAGRFFVNGSMVEGKFD